MNVLLSAPGAPLKQALIDAGIGKDILSSYDSDTYQTTLSIIAKNSEESRKMNSYKLSMIAWKVVEEGIDNKALAAAINLFEFRYRDMSYGSYPKGLIWP